MGRLGAARTGGLADVVKALERDGHHREDGREDAHHLDEDSQFAHQRAQFVVLVDVVDQGNVGRESGKLKEALTQSDRFPSGKLP